MKAEPLVMPVGPTVVLALKKLSTLERKKVSVVAGASSDPKVVLDEKAPTAEPLAVLTAAMSWDTPVEKLAFERAVPPTVASAVFRAASVKSATQSRCRVRE